MLICVQKNHTFRISQPFVTFSFDSRSNETSGSIASRESFESKEDLWSKPTHSDTESAENASIISGKTETESGRVTPEQPR